MLSSTYWLMGADEVFDDATLAGFDFGHDAHAISLICRFDNIRIASAPFERRHRDAPWVTDPMSEGSIV
jgi:hypothetical protein